MLNTAKMRRKKKQQLVSKLTAIVNHVPTEPDRLDVLLDGLDDGWNGIRKKIIELSAERGEWGGYPLPVEHAKLTVEPRHPLAATMEGATTGEKEIDNGEKLDIVNQWTDYKRGYDVWIVRKDGRSSCWVMPKYGSTGRSKFILDTLMASQAWSVEAEFTAMTRLKTLVTPAAFRYYLLTGTFIESSPRSKVFYLFRKCRPTVAFKGIAGGDDTKVLCCLCMHPIGYYQGTYAGSMVPTDDVIAHLIMMRGDERKFWSKCNQHSSRSPEAGL